MTRSADISWDVLVIGAGPAGSVAAHECSRRGLSVLLVDKASFPRSKVCGGCLSHVAVDLLKHQGLFDAVAKLHPPTLRELDMRCAGKRLSLTLPPGMVISRSALDHALLEQAVAAGATFRSRVSATIDSIAEDHARVHLREDGASMSQVRAKVVLVATGLAGMDFSNMPGLARKIAMHAPIGSGVFIDDPNGFPAGVIHMAVDGRGYVGLSRVEDGRLDIGAAFDPAACRQAGGVGELAAAIIHQAGFDVPCGLAEARWAGTPRLTTRPAAVAMGRVLLVGDSAGYVEPFTGEGMSWAIMGATAVAPLVAQHLQSKHLPSSSYLAKAWIVRHRKLLHRRQWMCHCVTRLLRHPRLTRGVMGVLSSHRAWADWVASRVHQGMVWES